MSSATLSPGAQIFVDPDYRFEHAAEDAAPGVQVAYEAIGERGAPLVFVLGGISANSHVASHAANPAPGWWEALVGAGRAIDPASYLVVGVDWLGGSGASSGPARAEAHALPVPVTARDQARALRSLARSLGYERVHAIVGSSYGGMVGLAFAEQSPDALGRLLCLCAAHRSDPWTTASRALARRVLRHGLAAERAGGGDGSLVREALSIARGLGMLSYRTREEFEQRFAGEHAIVEQELGPWARFDVEDYLEARGRDFAARFGADAIHTLSQSIDLHRVAPADVRVPVYLAAAPSDRLVPIALVRELAEALPELRALVPIDSVFGHDAFLKELSQVARFVAEALADRGDSGEEARR